MWGAGMWLTGQNPTGCVNASKSGWATATVISACAKRAHSSNTNIYLLYISYTHTPIPPTTHRNSQINPDQQQVFTLLNSSQCLSC